ncbi:MAG: glutamate--cysteine ligase [Nocardioidaceae bacterium]
MAAPTRSARKVGVEEELMLVDPDTGRLRAVSHRAVSAHREKTESPGPDGQELVEQELFLQQLETGTAPCVDMTELMTEVRRCRRAAADSAHTAGADLVAVATPVLGGEDREVTPKARYQRIVEGFGEIGRQGSVCGMHVHVDVADDEEAVRVIDRLRPWLPVLRALSVNSPYWYGGDTGYASWRSQVWGRWPSAGPTEPYGDLTGYRRATQAVIASGAALDHGMLYLDARPSESYPTVELRVFDVVTEIADIGLLAALSRALVDTLATADQSAPSPWRTDLVRAAHWRASRDGLSRELLHPLTGELEPARAVVEAAIEHCHGSLEASGDLELVQESAEALLARGTGATRQRAVAERTGPDVASAAVVADLRERFTASLEDPSN